jgi:hypothetical protein
MLKTMMAIFSLLMATGILEIDAMAVYDCADPKTRFHTLNLLHPESCPDPVLDFQAVQNKTIQIVQTQADLPITGQQCLISISKQIQRCEGIGSNAYGPPEFTVWEQVLKLTGRQCTTAIAQRYYLYENYRIPVKEGVTSDKWWSKGKRKTNGRCEYDNVINGDTSAGFTSGGRIFAYHIEQTLVTLRVATITGTVDTGSKVVNFEGIQAAFLPGEVHDGQKGTIVWNTTLPSCAQTTSQVYLGQAKLYQRVGEATSLTGSVVMVENQDTHQFAGLALKNRLNICGTRCYATQLKGILVCIIPHDNEPIPRREFRPEFDQEAITQGARLGHLVFETNLRVSKRFVDVQGDICQVERKTAYNKLQALAGGDNEYALLNTYGRGHRLFKAGNVAYVAQCIEKEATVASFSNCTEEVPVRVIGTNRTVFADPYTWVLQDLATVIPCSSLTPVMWLVGETWWKSTPDRTKEFAPRKLNMSSSSYTSLGDFTVGAGESMYSHEQMTAHRRFQQSQISRKAVAQHVTNTAMANAVDGVPGSPLNGLEVDQLRDIVAGFLFPLFPLVGQAWYTLMTVLLIANIIRIGVGWMIRTYIMYQERGCGLWFCAACSNTFFHLARTPLDLIKTVTANILNNPLEIFPMADPEREKEALQALKEERQRKRDKLATQKKRKAGFLGRKTKQFFKKNVAMGNRQDRKNFNGLEGRNLGAAEAIVKETAEEVRAKRYGTNDRVSFRGFINDRADPDVDSKITEQRRGDSKPGIHNQGPGPNQHRAQTHGGNPGQTRHHSSAALQDLLDQPYIYRDQQPIGCPNPYPHVYTKDRVFTERDRELDQAQARVDLAEAQQRADQAQQDRDQEEMERFAVRHTADKERADQEAEKKRADQVRAQERLDQVGQIAGQDDITPAP